MPVYKPLVVGESCVSGRHVIKSEDDIMFLKNGRRRCRACKQLADGSKPNLLERGSCSKNHPITSVDDTYQWRQNGKTVYRCKICAIAAASREGCGPVGRHRTWVEFGCSHENVFSPPLPKLKETVYCMKCREYRKVVRWGDPVEKVELPNEMPIPVARLILGGSTAKPKSGRRW